ncbi:MAG TPA: tRNA (N6-isopentenyl adenosine(37)-C2)-methylthiotransferase MiaB [Candidatus Polarisedimenticolia bacterium]|nr:tRNA (N6-isopentenyl adenosine(37)-C2)-methylthiotransferase MiaB [Candidatus Polarisedimenticolia bacterium]
MTAPAAAGALAGLRTYRIETWGCQMNEHDSEKMAGVLTSLGLAPAGTEADADIILLNTCSVREKAAQKVFTRLGQLRRHKERRPHVILGVCGCVAQQEQERIFRRAPFVDLVMGPRRIGSLPELIEESRARRHALGIFDPRDSLVEEAPARRTFSRTRAYVTVMEGCNKTCTFCIVPVTRGREACRSAESILREARECVAQGLTEIQLLGQNVNAWRHRSGEWWDFTRLLGAVALVPGLKRLRFTTSHPLHFKDSIIDMMASREAICRHLHLPVQSGSDGVLAAMRRGYTAADYLGRVDRLRRRVPDVALSTDVIVGFPGETEEDFKMTLGLLRAVEFDSIYSFVYSPRPSTPAAGLADDVHDGAKKERLHRLQALQEEIQMRRNATWVGRRVEVLVDGPARQPEKLAGRTSQNHLVILEGDASLMGRLVDVRITRAGPHSLTGERITP